MPDPTWLLTLASLVGVILNIHHRRECFAVWGFTNAAWCVIDLHHNIPAQAALQGVYCGLSVWGLWKWRKAA